MASPGGSMMAPVASILPQYTPDEVLAQARPAVFFLGAVDNTTSIKYYKAASGGYRS